MGVALSELPDKMTMQIFKNGTASIIRSLFVVVLFFRKMLEQGSGLQIISVQRQS